MHRIALVLIAALLPAAACAHDTWFGPLSPTDRGELVLALGTGTRFPKWESGLEPGHIASSGCRGDGVSAAPLRHLEDARDAIVLRSAGRVPMRAAITCWAQLVPFEIEIGPDRVKVYLDEINASAALRAVEAQRRARGLPWKERYLKHARIELGRADGPLRTEPLPLGMDVTMQAPRRPLQRGDVVDFQVWRDGRPLADQPMELIGDGTPVGVWLRTDAEGRLRAALPAPGQWVLRGVDLRAPAADDAPWLSDFVTLVFEVSAPR